MKLPKILKFQTLQKEANIHYMALALWVFSVLVFALLVLSGALLSWLQLSKLSKSISFDFMSNDSKAADDKKLKSVRQLLKILQKQDKPLLINTQNTDSTKSSQSKQETLKTED